MRIWRAAVNDHQPQLNEALQLLKETSLQLVPLSAGDEVEGVRNKGGLAGQETARPHAPLLALDDSQNGHEPAGVASPNDQRVVLRREQDLLQPNLEGEGNDGYDNVARG